MNDKELESLLMDEVLEEKLDNEMVKRVSPRKINWIFIIIGMVSLAFDFKWLIGCVILMLGFRGIKTANKWFLGGYIFSICNVVYVYANRFIGSSIWNEEIWELPFYKSGVGHYLGIVFSVCTFICLWRAIVSAEKKAGITVHSISPLMYVIWYVLVSAINIMGVAGETANTIIIIGFIIIVIGIYNIYKEFEDVEYILRSSNIIIPDIVVFIGIVAIYCVVTISIYMNNEYPMEWKEVSVVENVNVDNIKSHLLELGVPKKVLDDMTAEDILKCENAVEAIVYENAYKNEDSIVDGSDYEGENSCENIVKTTNVSLRLDEEGYFWRMIYYFEYDNDVDFNGSNAIKIEDYDHSSGDALIRGDITGLVIGSKDNKTLVSEYYGLYERSYSNYAWYRVDNGKEIIAEFSYDNKMEERRGYITYEVEEWHSFSYRPTCYITYVYLDKRYAYPAMTASDLFERDMYYYTLSGYSSAKYVCIYDETYRACRFTFEEVE